MTIEDVSNYTGLHWHTIKKMDKEYLKRRYRKMDFRRVKYIAIDEFAVSKGHQYMTVVMDLETKRALYVKKGKDGASLREFWKEIKKQKVKIKAVAIDMSPAYIKSVTDHIGYDKIVFDWFHIKKKINFEIDELRREMCNEEEKLGIRQVMKGSRWLLLKNSENLKTEKDEKQKLEKVLQMNKPLATMYYMKEELTTMWWLGGKVKSETYLQSWVLRAINSGIKQLIKVGNMIGSFRTAILRWFDFDISLSTGPLEGFNNKIKVLKRKAYGYRDIDYFGLKIFDLHNYRLKYALMR